MLLLIMMSMALIMMPTQRLMPLMPLMSSLSDFRRYVVIGPGPEIDLEAKAQIHDSWLNIALCHLKVVIGLPFRAG